jgi:uncharacterized protein YhaN
VKIKSIYISAFGGIKNLELNLESTFNIVYGDNENGKTTIMNFIKMMFYGTERGSAQLNKNLRKKYTPWDNSQMAGSIVFEHKGRTYKLERIFGNSNSTDKVTLRDLSIGTAKSVGSDIGSRLFGLSVAAFERSIFIGQFGFPDNNDLATGELNGKLSNIALTGDEAVSFDAINKRLETAKTQLMSKSGRTGIYDKNLKLCATLEGQLETEEKNQERIKDANNRIAQITEQIKLTQQKADKLKQQIESENDIRNSEKLRELLTLKAQLDDVNKGLALSDGKLADEVFVKKVEFCLNKIENIGNKIFAKQNENQLLQNNLNLALNVSGDATPQAKKELTEKVTNLENEKRLLTEQITDLEQQPQKKNNPVWFILAAVFAVFGAVGFIFSPVITVCGLAVAVVFICIALITASKIKAQNGETKSQILDLKLKENQLISVIATEKAKLAAITTALNANLAMIENQKEMIDSNNAEIKPLNDELEAEQQILFNLFATFKPCESITEIAVMLDEIKRTASVQKEIKQKMNYISKDVGNISYEQIKEKLDSLGEQTKIDFTKIKADYETTLKDLTDLKTKVAAIMAEIGAITANAKNPDNIKAELESLRKKTDAQKEYCDCLQIAISVLNDSYAEVRQSYGSVLEKNAGEIFSSLTDGNYQNMSISKSFDIAVEKTDIFGSKELDYLSSGTVDQAYLSLRLALSKLISQDGEALPIILDDALAQYDDKRTATALKFLKEYSEKGQIILFTCHKAIVNLANGLEANNISL